LRRVEVFGKHPFSSYRSDTLVTGCFHRKTGAQHLEGNFLKEGEGAEKQKKPRGQESKKALVITYACELSLCALCYGFCARETTVSVGFSVPTEKNTMFKLPTVMLGDFAALLEGTHRKILMVIRLNNLFCKF
jgi:hypothetical protein